MIGKVYSVPEQAMRNLPNEIPGLLGSRILASGSLTPDSHEPTASTIIFQVGQEEFTLQFFPPAIPSVDKHCQRDLFAALLHKPNKRTKLDAIEDFLHSLGAQPLGSGSSDLESIKISRFAAIEEENNKSEQGGDGDAEEAV